MNRRWLRDWAWMFVILPPTAERPQGCFEAMVFRPPRTL